MALTYRELLKEIVKHVPYKELDQPIKLKHFIKELPVNSINTDTLPKVDIEIQQIDKQHTVCLFYDH